MGFVSKIVVTMSDLNREPSRIARAASQGPVIITDRGRPVRVLITFEEFERLTAAREPRSLLQAFEALPDTSDIDWEISEAKGNWGLKVPGPE